MIAGSRLPGARSSYETGNVLFKDLEARSKDSCCERWLMPHARICNAEELLDHARSQEHRLGSAVENLFVGKPRCNRTEYSAAAEKYRVVVAHRCS